jgi:hypothetical protein
VSKRLFCEAPKSLVLLFEVPKSLLLLTEQSRQQ